VVACWGLDSAQERQNNLLLLLPKHAVQQYSAAVPQISGYAFALQL
jgi:hypothetical protein